MINILCQLDAEVFDVMIVFKYAIGKPGEGLENRFKQLRTIITKSGWESSEDRANKVKYAFLECAQYLT